MFHASFNYSDISIMCFKSKLEWRSRGPESGRAAIFLARDGAARAPAMAGPAPRHPTNRQ